MPHYHDNTPLEETFIITAAARGTQLTFESAPGLFSKDKLDSGTKLLLDSCSLPEKGRILDLGCGIGVVGVFVKTWLPSLDVVQSDITEKAVTLTKKNAKHSRVHTTVVLSNIYSNLQSEKFDSILVNPPRAAGKAVIERMIREAPEHLNTRGTLQLVAMTNKGGKSYEKMMAEAFGNVETIARGSGFKVYRSNQLV